MVVYLKATLLLALLSFNGVGAGWQQPIGVPMPPFGITNTVWDLTNFTYNFGTGAVSYPIGPNGPYTHWVDSTHVSATDSGNPYGSPSLPRLTFPNTAEAPIAGFNQQGNILEVHGGPYYSANGGLGTFYFLPDFLGTNNSVSRPSYIRGGTYSTRPMFVGAAALVAGKCFIIENVCFTNKGDGTGILSINGGGMTPPIDTHNIVIRSNEFASYGGNLGNGTVVGIGSTAAVTVQVSNTVVFGNWIHHFGDTNQAVENDMLGCKIFGEDVYHTWVVDNHIHNMGGDGVAAGSNAYTDGGNPVFPYHSANQSRFIFFGRNNLHHNGENSVDIKVCKDVVFSENHCYSNHQAGVVFHYNGENGWVIGNWIHDNNNSQPVGVVTSGFVDLHVGGNLFTDSTSALESAAGGAVAMTWNNTFARCESGAYSTGSTTNYLINNIFFSNSVGAINYESASSSGSRGSNDLFWPPVLNVSWPTLYTSLGALQSGSGTFQNSLTNNPLFVDAANNNFNLTNGSPAIGAALVSFSVFKSNEFWSYFGVAIPASTDLGAWSAALSVGGGSEPVKRRARAGRVMAVKIIN